jgi:hypothetical protein
MDAYWIEKDIKEQRITELEIENGWYLPIGALLDLMPEVYARILQENYDLITTAAGSSHNHQAWRGGYLDHVVETMNIACQQFRWMDKVRVLPFTLYEALEVLFLHDIEKPWKYAPNRELPAAPELRANSSFRCLPVKTKEDRKKFRDAVIEHYKIELTDDQKNALRYIEGVPDSEYTPGERTMGELAAFCHTCDILSARMWHDQGKDVVHGAIRWGSQ